MTTRLDRRIIQDIVQHRQQRLTRVIDRLYIIPAARGERLPSQQLGGAENAMQRRADLMTHRRQKRRLGIIGLLRGGSCLAVLNHQRLQLGGSPLYLIGQMLTLMT